MSEIVARVSGNIYVFTPTIYIYTLRMSLRSTCIASVIVYVHFTIHKFIYTIIYNSNMLIDRNSTHTHTHSNQTNKFNSAIVFRDHLYVERITFSSFELRISPRHWWWLSTSERARMMDELICALIIEKNVLVSSDLWLNHLARNSVIKHLLFALTSLKQNSDYRRRGRD